MVKSGLTAAGLAFTMVAGARAADQWRTVQGGAIPALFAGKELSDGVHFAYRFGPDGRFSGTEMGKDVHGKWRVEGDEMCWLWSGPASQEECYAVQSDAATVRLLMNGSEAWRGTLRPGRRDSRR